MKKLSLCLTIVIAIFFFSSCQKKPDAGGTTTQNFANEWWVQLYEPSGSLPSWWPSTYYAHIATYNAAANDNTFWINDFPEIATSPSPHWTGNVWAFRFKATANLSSMTFSASQAASDLVGTSNNNPVEYKIKVNVTEGRILENAGHSKTGVLTDSIYMKIEFSDDPGTIYTMAGHARTRFAEDDY